ncbi:MAG: DNA-binding protein [Catenulispora sp.]|nr:DNA-binding protein [Catenulispora sp.]
MTTQYEKYQRPVKPEDPDAEYLTIQETAYVFRCSVKTIERRALSMGLGSKIGHRKMLSREDRRAMYEGRRDGTPVHISTPRRRRTAKKPATPARAAA